MTLLLSADLAILYIELLGLQLYCCVPCQFESTSQQWLPLDRVQQNEAQHPLVQDRNVLGQTQNQVIRYYSRASDLTRASLPGADGLLRIICEAAEL